VKFNDWRDFFSGEDAVVVAPGPSSKAPDIYDQLKTRWTLVCNRAVTYVSVDIGICVEPFRDKVWPIMRSAAPMVVFSHLCQDRRGRQPFPRIVEFPSKDVLSWFAPRRVGVDPPLWAAMSPFWATAVASWLGFETIGLIGVDLNDGSRWHMVTRENHQWERLLDLLPSKVVNLSKESRLTAVLQGDFEDIRNKGGK
jgi:hypothetical protein